MSTSKQQIIDISPLISPNLAVFPGDTPYSRTVALSFEQGHNLRLSAIHASVHLGAHVDAPSHYHQAGVPITEMPLDLYYGDCQVVEVRSCGSDSRVGIEHLVGAIQAPRILLKTRSFSDFNCWDESFWGLCPELIRYLASKGVRLIGVDTPSVDCSDDKELFAHQAVYKHGLAILEGLVLDAVPAGHYTLVALPLKLADADASPVRAVLVAG
jgi:arylformamidase